MYFFGLAIHSDATHTAHTTHPLIPLIPYTPHAHRAHWKRFSDRLFSSAIVESGDCDGPWTILDGHDAKIFGDLYAESGKIGFLTYYNGLYVFNS